MKANILMKKISPNPKNSCSDYFNDWLEVMLTPNCNGTCSWCVEKKGYHPENKDSLDKLYEVILSTKKKNVILLGGEPTLYPNIKELIDLLSQAGKNVYLTTNGSLLKNDFYKNLTNLSGLNVSIHHFDLYKNQEIVGINIDKKDLYLTFSKLKNHNVKIRLNCNLIDSYIDSEEVLYKYIDFAKSLNVDSIRFAELKNCDGSFISLGKILDYEYGLNEDPFTKGCWKHANINGMEISFRQMCGFQTSLRPKPKNPQWPKQSKNVVYYDGTIYNNWQKGKDHLIDNKKLKDKLDVIFDNMKNNSISNEEAKKIIKKFIK